MMRRTWWMVGLAVAGAAPLIWIVIRFAGRPLSVAFWYVLWRADLFLKTVNQQDLWLVLLCLAAAIAIRSLLQRPAAGPESREEPSPQAGPVRELADSVGRAEEAYYFRWRLAGRLGGLVVDALEAAGPRVETSTRQWWAKNSRGVPAAIRAYVEAALWGGFAPPKPAARLRPRFKPAQAVSPLDLDLETVVRFLEEQVEGENERRGP